MNNNFILKDSDKIEFSVEGKGYIKVYPPLTDIEITPNKETQVFKNSEEYGYDHVTVKPIPETYINPTGSLTINENGVKNVREFQNVVVDIPIPEPEIVIPDGYINPKGTKTITENGITNIREYENVDVNIEIPEVEINLQSKEITPTKESQTVTSDSNYDGLSSVTVNPIPDEYIIPNGTLPITENTTYDVRKYASVSASVHPAPTLQDKSVTITENGTQTVTADSGYDGLGNVEVITNIESSGGGDSEGSSISSIDELPEAISNSANELIISITNNYPTYTNDGVTLYTPNANYKNYIIRKRSDGYGIIWFPTISIGVVAGYIKPCKYTVSSFDIGSIPTTNYSYQSMTGYMSNGYASFEECLAAIQSSNTTYTTSTSLDWSNVVDGEFEISATNTIITTNNTTRRISSDETIEVIS